MRPSPLFLTLAAGVVGLCGTPAGAADPERNGPSFDCSRAETDVEKAICASPALSSLDGQIAIRYRALLEGLDMRSAEKLAQDQKWFIEARNRLFADASPAARIDMLRDRLSFLNRTGFSAPAGVEGQWRNAAGEITITRDPAGGLTMTANAAEPSSGRWVCDATGRVEADGTTAWTATTTDPAGRLMLTRDGAALEVQEPQGRSSPFCGLNGSLAGSYFRLGAAVE